jgi:hypothetical protein
VFRAIIKKKSNIAATLFDFVCPGPSDVAKFSPCSDFIEIIKNTKKLAKGTLPSPLLEI